MPAAPAPESILIFKGGGDSGIYSELLMNYHGLPAITVPIRQSWDDFRVPEPDGEEKPYPLPRRGD